MSDHALLSAPRPLVDPADAMQHWLNQQDLLLFHSADLEQARSLVAQVIKPHRLESAGAGPMRARMFHATVGALELSQLGYGSSVQIDRIEPLSDFYLVQMPLNGHAAVRSGSQSLQATPGMASVLGPEEGVSMRWSSDCEQFMLRLERQTVERCLVGMLGHSADKPLVFELGFDWQGASAWSECMRYLCAQAGAAHWLQRFPLVVSHMEHMAASLLLALHRHNYSDMATQRRDTVLPRHVRRAQDFLHAKLHDPICADEIAGAAGVSLRSLYAGFKEYLDTTPMHYLRDLRLERVRKEFLSSEEVSVANIAMRWGFAHMGRFSGEYRKRFGETPSQTLRRR